MVFDTVTLSEGFFSGPNKVLCAAPFGRLFCCAIVREIDTCTDQGRRVAHWTSDGVYFQDLTNPKRNLVRGLYLADVLAQIDMSEEFRLVIVLSGLSFHFFSVICC